MPNQQDTLVYQLLATKYDPSRELEAIEILRQDPSLATLTWLEPDDDGQPFVKRSTALHYAANDGKLQLMSCLVERGADVNASEACWFRSVLSWAANNAQLEAMRWLLDRGARPDSLDALHAAAWGGPSRGADETKDYAAAVELLIEAGADKNDSRHCNNRTPLRVAMEIGHESVIQYLRSIGAAALG
jgi:ankyrin repeat protein